MKLKIFLTSEPYNHIYKDKYLKYYNRAEPQFAQAVSASVSAAASGPANNNPAEGPLASFVSTQRIFCLY